MRQIFSSSTVPGTDKEEVEVTLDKSDVINNCF